VSALKQRGLTVRLVVTGPTAPHHPQRSRSYLEELKAQRRALEVDQEVIFLADELNGTLPEHEIAELYALSDCLLFPSYSEGFGLPILEAGMTGVTVVASDIPIFREIGGDDIAYFRLDASPDTVAESILRAVDTPASRLRRRVRREFRWESIFDRLVMPMLASNAPPKDLAVGVPA
jgi:glycosyltransferase involved in cell wall biosynthesis